MVRYAEINSNGVCFAVSDFSRPVSKPTLIQVNGSPEECLGKRWNGTEWETAEPVPEPETYSESELLTAYKEGVESVG